MHAARSTLDYYLERERERERWLGTEETDSQKRKKMKWGNGEREVVTSGSLLLSVITGWFMDNPTRLCRVNCGNLKPTT
jgi:hypothetical protein